MTAPENITCPVCGRPNRNRDQCTFCGAGLQEAGSSQAERQVEGTLTRPEDHSHPRSGEMSRPPFPSQPTPHWEGPSFTPKFAGFWIRTVAYTIDGFVMLVILGVLVGVGVFGYVSGSETDALGGFSNMFFETNWNFMNVVVFFLNMAYFTYFLGTRGQTPGKMICGLKVIRLDGSPVSYGQAAVRTLGYYLNHLTLCIGFLWVAFDPRKQGLHDKIAGTYEIRIGLAEVREWQSPPPSQGRSG